MIRNVLLIFSIIGLFAGCKSSKNLSTVESVTTNFEMPDLKSTINLHYKISKQTTRDTFNRIIDQYLAEGIEMSAMGFDVVVKKYNQAELEIAGKRVLSKMPIEISISKNTFIKNVKARGVLDLNFLTDIDIDAEWNFLTETSLEHYQWLVEPKLDLGGFSIPIEKLANVIIEQSKPQLEQQINLSINEQLSIKEKMLDMMKYVENPIEVDTIMNSWVHLVPEKVYMSEIVNEEDWSRGNVTIHNTTKISETRPIDVMPALNLPRFAWEEKLDDTSHINIVMNISYDNINRLLVDRFKGQTFSGDGKTIKINDIKMYQNGEKLVTEAEVSGSINGQLLVSGKPIFDNEKQVFYTDDIDIDVRTKNMLHKAGAWLFKGKIKNRLKDLMYFSLSENLEAAQEKVNTELTKYSIPKELELVADIKKLNVNKFVLDQQQIHAFITLNIYLEAIIYDMRVFGNQNIKAPLKG